MIRTLSPTALSDLVGQLPNGELHGIAQIDRLVPILRRHEAHETVHQLVHVAEGAGLFSRSVERELLTSQRLHDEVRDHPAIRFRHPRAVGIEDPGDPNVYLVLAVIVHEQGLGDALPLVIAGARSDRIHVAPVGLDLWMDGRVTVDLGRRRLEDPGAEPVSPARAC